MGEIKIGSYLLERLAELGVKTVQGVPGDFNMGLLDLVEDHGVLRWVGNGNELNAAYSADGYARVSGGLGVVVTTFGVGELSALNGVAGAFSERVPLVHVVGVPSTAAQGGGLMLHHTLGDGRFGAFENMSREISAAMAVLDSPVNAAARIDATLHAALTHKRPVYIALPTDLVHASISDEPLHTRIDTQPPPHDDKAQAYVLDVAQRHIENAARPVILVDACAIRYDCTAEVRDLVDRSGLPVFATPMGKSAIDETHPQYGGIYVGSLTAPHVRDAVERADLLITIGALQSDFNTGNFTYRTPRESTIELHSDKTIISYSHYPGIGMKRLLPQLAARLHPRPLPCIPVPVPRFSNVLPDEKDSVISQAWFWPRIGQFFRPEDQVVVETGTSSFGMLEAQLPARSRFVAQILWGSIGWSVGATLGVALAARERGLGRTCLFVGDGSLQLTVQEIGTMIRHGLTPFLFVLNNEGYEIERQIHGPNRAYNDIAPYNHALLLDTLSAPPGHEAPRASRKKYHAVTTKQQLNTLLLDPDFQRADCIQLVEVFMRRGDAPAALKRQAQATSSANKYE